MEEDILKYSPTVMFRGTPCNLNSTCILKYEYNALTFVTNMTTFGGKNKSSIFLIQLVDFQKNTGFVFVGEQ